MPLFNDIEGFKNVDPALQWAIFIVGCLIIIVALVSVVVSIWLGIKYVIYNRTLNKAGINGEQTARKILDSNGLSHIKVSVVESLMFGNSYSHFFKKVRLRRWTVKKNSISSMAMGAQKSCLAILDKEGDKDMKTRIILTPLMYFGPFAFIPLLIVGILIDVIVFGFNGWCTMIFAGLGLLFYVISFVSNMPT